MTTFILRPPVMRSGGAGRPGVLALLAIVMMSAAGAGQEGTFPPRLEKYFAAVKLSRGERQRLLAGQPITKLLDADASKEVAVLGAIWIATPTTRYVEAVQDIETFESGGGFKVTKRISSPPRLEDFAALTLPDEDIDDLRKCRVGDCEVKLSEEALRRFQSEIQWDAPTARQDVNALMRQLALNYVNGYLHGGNSELAVYRDSSRPRFVAREFESMLAGMPELTNEMPNVRRYLLEYPKTSLPGATSFLYWQETEFGLKPTIRISHLTIWDTGDATVIASKLLYASHYFWTGLEIRALVPDPARGEGFWLVMVNRARSDGLSGFTGTFVRRRVRGEVQDGVLGAQRATKRKLERSG